MKFSHGVYAQVEFVPETKNYHSTYLAGCSEDLYDYLEYKFGHEVAADASSWAELACVGEEYEHEEFTLTMVEL